MHANLETNIKPIIGEDEQKEFEKHDQNVRKEAMRKIERENRERTQTGGKRVDGGMAMGAVPCMAAGLGARRGRRGSSG